MLSYELEYYITLRKVHFRIISGIQVAINTDAFIERIISVRFGINRTSPPSPLSCIRRGGVGKRHVESVG